MNIGPLNSRIRSASFKISVLLSSDRFLYFILFTFLLQALWFIFSYRFPMAFDESFHFGLIQKHATQWLPYFTHQPPYSQSYGAVARDPSYLYHYLLSIIYRLIDLFTHKVAVQILLLRLLNAGLFASSFFLFRKLLLQLGSSKAMAHSILLLFSLLPVVPFLAAQINYDNMLIPLLIWSLVETIRWTEDLRANRLSVARTIILWSIMLLTCLVKYVFLPIMAILVGIMLWQLVKRRAPWRVLRKEISVSIRSITLPGKIILIALFVIASGLFMERYAVNLWRYKSPTPECEKVLRIDECLEYGPWQRDYLYAKVKPNNFHPNVISYANMWVYWMWRRLFFAISYLNENIKPLYIPWQATAYVTVVSLGLIIVYGVRLLKRNPYCRYVLIIIAVYVAALFGQTWQAYIKTAQPVAINGRYLTPFIPILMLFAGLAFRELYGARQWLKSVTIVFLLFVMLQGGGVETFILQSDPHWDWQNNAVINANNAARAMLQPIVYGSMRKDW